MTLLDRMKYLAAATEGHITIELEPMDFYKVYKEAVKDFEKSGLRVIEDSRYLDGTATHEGRILQWGGLLIKEVL